MKRLGIVGVVTALVTMLTFTAAVADTPPGLLDRGFPVVCDGEETVAFGGNGRSAWIDGELYQAVLFEVTFTPFGEDPMTFVKQYGNGPKGDTIDCSAAGADQFGTFEFNVVAVKVPRK